MSDVMFYGVLRMPYEMAMEGEINRLQFWQRAQEAVSRVEHADAEIAELRTALAVESVALADAVRHVGNWKERYLHLCEITDYPAIDAQPAAQPVDSTASAFEMAAQACDQQADGTNGPYRSACLQCANAVRELRDAASAADESSLPSSDPVVETNVALLRSRSAVGIEKYGVTLAGNNLPLRAWLVHALEESLDHANYLQRAMMEIDKS